MNRGLIQGVECCIQFAHPRGIIQSLVAFLVLGIANLSAAGEMLVQLGANSNWGNVTNYAQGIVAQGDSTKLGISSAGSPGQTNFDDQTVKVRFSVGTGGVSLAAFSDDGVNVTVKDLTAGSGEVAVLSRKGVGQALPNLAQSLHALEYAFQAGHNYEITVGYLNTLYTGDGDVDGAQLIAYAGQISGPIQTLGNGCRTWTTSIDVQDQIREIINGERKPQGAVARINATLSVCEPNQNVTLTVVVRDLCLDLSKSTQFSMSPVLTGFPAGSTILEESEGDGNRKVGASFSKDFGPLDSTSGSSACHLMTYPEYAEVVEGALVADAAGMNPGVATEFGRHVCIRWNIAADGETATLSVEQGPAPTEPGEDVRARCCMGE